MSLIGRAVSRAARVIAVFAPAPLRVEIEREGFATIEAICADVARRRGRIAAAFAGAAELGSVLLAVIRARTGRRMAISWAIPAGRHDVRRTNHLLRLTSDVGLAIRAVRASKRSSTLIVLTLSLGVGVTSAVFSILDAVVIRPAPFARADRLVEVLNLQTTTQVTYPGFRRPLLLAWRDQTDLFERFEAYEVTSVVLDNAAGAEMLTGAVVTPGLLSMLGVPPRLGRLFADGDGRGGTADRLVISARFWRERFGADPAAIGRSVGIGGRPSVVIGVMPDAFRFPNDQIRFWTAYDLESPPPEIRVPSLVAFGRLRDGLPFEEAARRVTERGQSLSRAAGGPVGRSAVLQAFGSVGDRKLTRSLLVLGAAAFCVLLIVCANIASLSLARTLGRARDLAVRSALGASRWDLVRAAVVEHVLVSAAGAMAGLAVASSAVRLTAGLLPERFRLSTMNDIDLDARAIAFTIAVGVVAAAISGLPPAWLASREAAIGLLKRDGRSSTGSIAFRRLRSGLVVAEVSLAIVLLVGAALMTRSFVKLQQVERGFDAGGLVAVRVGLPASGYTDPYMRDQFTAAVLELANKAPGITSATAGGVPPSSNKVLFGTIERADRPGETTGEMVVPVYEVWENYFSAVGIPLRQGRAFAADEPPESTIVSESFSRRYWPDSSAIGRRIRVDAGEWRTIVGVAGEVRQMGLDDSSGSFEFYVPLRRPRGRPARPEPNRGAIADYRTIVARADHADVGIAQLRSLIHEVDRGVVIWRADRVEQLFADAVARPRIVLLLMTVFGGLGLSLAAAGIYGVLSYAVAQRRREIGVRLALGARREDVGRLILGGGLALTATGLAAGVAGALGLTQVMRTMLYEVEPMDPLSIGAAAAVILVTAFFAAWPPARRAMRLDPVRLLRED